jgi:hypothetical protein
MHLPGRDHIARFFVIFLCLMPNIFTHQEEVLLLNEQHHCALLCYFPLSNARQFYSSRGSAGTE